MSEIKKKQYNLLNALKIIAAFFVVCIHVHFPGDFGRAVVAVARFAVPFFFMVSGFFSYYENNAVLADKYKRKIRHILILLLGGSALYFVFGFGLALIGGNGLSYVTKIFSLSSFAEFIVFNNTSVSEFLWFMPALIYTYFVFFLFERKGITKKLYFLIPVLFLAGVILREIPEFFENTPAIMDKAYFCRNFLFVGLPFFMLGHFIKANEEKLKAKLSCPVLVVMMAAGTAEAVIADFLHVQKSVYIGTFFAVFALFVFVVKYEDKVSLKYLPRLGAVYSFYVYVIHIMIRNVVNKSGDIIPFAGKVLNMLDPVYPFVIFAMALAVSMIYVIIKQNLKKFLSKMRGKKI